MKAIPTVFDGIEYRSRLEARWAIFFQDLGLNPQYEPFLIKDNYLPDFCLFGLFFDQFISIVEIKPVRPNAAYIEFLRTIRDPKKSDFFVFVGPPSFVQPDGFVIFGANHVASGFELTICRDCGYYKACYNGFDICGCVHMPSRPSPNWESSARLANEFRFDL